MTDSEARRAHDIGDAIDLIWANALRAPRHSAQPEPRVSPRLGPSGECRLSQGEEK